MVLPVPGSARIKIKEAESPVEHTSIYDAIPKANALYDAPRKKPALADRLFVLGIPSGNHSAGAAAGSGVSAGIMEAIRLEKPPAS